MEHGVKNSSTEPAAMESVASLGQLFRVEREKRGLNLDQVSQSTRISIKNLEALEEDRIHALPHATFVKGYLGTLGRFYNLDAADLTRRYQVLNPLESPVNQVKKVLLKQNNPPSVQPKGSSKASAMSLAPMGITEEKRQRQLFLENPRRKVFFISATAISVLAVLVLAFLILASQRRLNQLQAQTRQLQEQMLTAQKDALDKKMQEELAAHKKANHVLKIKAKSDTWYRIFLDGKYSEKWLKAGLEMEYLANERMELITGNLNGLELLYNDQPFVPPPPTTGRKRLQFPPKSP